jgi:alpha-beta hydrolase superfamily lysophospholipase
MSQPIQPFDLVAEDGAHLAAFRSRPLSRPRAVIQIAHGMAEHAARYARLTRALTDAGYTVYAADHRGHGGSAIVHGLGDFGPRGFAGVVTDMISLGLVARTENPGAPFILLGHSMGSFAAQVFILKQPGSVDALILSGTAASDKLIESILASGAGTGLESFNKAFEPARTTFDWLSRDPNEVDAYVADPLCGFELTPQSVQSVFELTAGATTDPRLSQVRKEMPVLVLSGEVDPVVGPGQGFAEALVNRYGAAGLTVDHRVSPGGRHELFNDICRDETTGDLIAWLDRRFPG